MFGRMRILAAALGVLLIGFALRDLFQTLFHVNASGILTRLVPRALWRMARATRRERAMQITGPVALVSVIFLWAALMVVGWALIYWGAIPSGFHFETGIVEKDAGFGTALYLSIVTIATLGYGDIVPATFALRMIAGAQGVFGFVLLSATISWVLSVSGVIVHERSFAHRLQLLTQEDLESVARSDPSFVARMLSELSAQLAMLRQDLGRFPIAYYFHASDTRDSLFDWLPWLEQTVQRIQHGAGSGALALEAATLRRALGDFCESLRDSLGRFQAAEGTAGLLQEYRSDHRR
jgi:voltage-gated potassium channel Kch